MSRRCCQAVRAYLYDIEEVGVVVREVRQVSSKLSPKERITKAAVQMANTEQSTCRREATHTTT